MPDDVRLQILRKRVKIVMPLIRCVYRLPITCSFLQAGFILQPCVSGDSRLIRRPSVASAFTEYNNRLPEPVIRVKQPALARFSLDIAPPVRPFPDDDVTARLYARKVFNKIVF